MGRAGYDPCGSSVTESPSIPRTRGKEIILEGNCEILGVENLEESLFLLSHPSLIPLLSVIWKSICRVPPVLISQIQNFFSSLLR